MARFRCLRELALGPSARVMAGHCVITIPVRSEAEHLGHCLDALAQTHQWPRLLREVILVLNSCDDSSWDTAARWAAGHDLPLRLMEVVLPASERHAGGARACALEVAVASVVHVPAAIVLTTDADSRVSPDWLTQAVAGIDGGADVVAGAITVNDAGRALWPLSLQRRVCEEDAYAALLDEIDSICDPVAHNPWPAHRRCSGANLAFSAEALRRLPTLPSPPCGEDRALVAACVARDLRVRYDPDLWVETSARLRGRAPGGMADTLRRRIADRHLPCDPMLESCPQLVHRARTRALGRRLFVTGMTEVTLARALGVILDSAGSPCVHFGQAWALLGQQIPRLRPTPVFPRDLVWEIGEATAWLARRAARSCQGQAA